MTKVPGFPGSIGFFTFLDYAPGASFYRRKLHPAGLGMGE